MILLQYDIQYNFIAHRGSCVIVELATKLNQFWEVAHGEERLPFQFAIEEGGITHDDVPKELLCVN